MVSLNCISDFLCDQIHNYKEFKPINYFFQVPYISRDDYFRFRRLSSFLFQQRSMIDIKNVVYLYLTKLKSFHSASVFPSMLVKREFRLEMLVGSCTAWSMEFSLMARCRATKPSAEEMIPSTRFSAKPAQENMFLALSLLI